MASYMRSDNTSGSRASHSRSSACRVCGEENDVDLGEHKDRISSHKERQGAPSIFLFLRLAREDQLLHKWEQRQWL